MTDEVVARRTGGSMSAVISRRMKLKVGKFDG
jgi:hypothetical protein